MKILVVDDDRLVCASLKTIIEAQGDIEVIGIGHNGEEAIAALDTGFYHCVLDLAG